MAFVPLADPFAVLQLLAAGGMLASNALLGSLITVVFYGLLGGRTFCAWVCPLNPVTDLATFTRALRSFGPGDLVEITVLRDSRPLNFTIVLGDRQDRK